MRKVMIAAAVAVTLGFGAAKAQAQVIGTGGHTLNPGVQGFGYYSPYPGALYSPFRPAPVVMGGFPRPNYYNYNPGFYNPGYYNPGFSNSGYGVTRYGQPGTYYQPAGRPGSYYRR